MRIIARIELAWMVCAVCAITLLMLTVKFDLGMWLQVASGTVALMCADFAGQVREHIRHQNGECG